MCAYHQTGTFCVHRCPTCEARIQRRQRSARERTQRLLDRTLRTPPVR